MLTPVAGSTKSDSTARLKRIVPNSGEMSPDNVVDVKMIDFAHTLPSAHGCCDAGYIHGLVSLIRHLKELQALIDAVDADILVMKVREIYRKCTHRNKEKAAS